MEAEDGNALANVIDSALEESTPTSKKPRTQLSNAKLSWVRKDGENIPVLKYRQIGEISKDLFVLCDGWPKAFSEIPFVLNGEKRGVLPGQSAVRLFRNQSDFFAWVSECCNLFWVEREVHGPSGEKLTPPTKAEFYSHIKNATPEAFTSYSYLPHEPPIPGTFYVPADLPETTGGKLETFLAALNPETEDDRELMKAAILTLFWGGPAGARPGFVFCSTHGRGSGKTATADAIASLSGGAVTMNHKETWEQFYKRLLSDSALHKRVILIDNQKGKLGGTNIESLTTAREINGWRPFHGDFARPNLTTLFVTSNTPQLSSDLTLRCIPIYIGRQRHAKAFIEWVREYIEENLGAMVAEIFGVLRGPPVGILSESLASRWQAWQRVVLCRCQNPDRLAALIAARSADVDADSDDAQEAADAIEAWVETKAASPASVPPTIDSGQFYVITKAQMAELLIAAKVVDDGFSRKGIGTWLLNLIGDNGPLNRLSNRKHGEHGRVWAWKIEHDIPV